MMDLAKYLIARLNEASTWATIAAGLAALHVNVDPGLWHQVTLWGAVFAGAAGVLISEQGKKPPATIAADILAAVAAGIKATPPEKTP